MHHITSTSYPHHIHVASTSHYITSNRSVNQPIDQGSNNKEMIDLNTRTRRLSREQLQRKLRGQRSSLIEHHERHHSANSFTFKVWEFRVERKICAAQTRKRHPDKIPEFNLWRDLFLYIPRCPLRSSFTV